MKLQKFLCSIFIITLVLCTLGLFLCGDALIPIPSVSAPVNQATYSITHPLKIPVLDVRVQVSPWARESVERAAEQGVCGADVTELPPDLRTQTTRRGCCELTTWFIAATQNCDEDVFYRTILHNRGKGGGSKTPSRFSDVYGAGPIDAMAELGVAKGRDDGSFGPDEPLARQEAAVFLARAYAVCGGALPQSGGVAAFADGEEIAPWARESVAALSELGFFQGNGAGNFDPHGAFSTEQCIVILGRMYDDLTTPKRLVTYEQYLAALEDGWPIVEQVEGSVATFVKQRDPIANSIPVVNYDCKLVYRDGGVRSLTDFAVCSDGRGWLSLEDCPPKDVRFSDDGKTLYCTITLPQDVNETSYGRHTHEAGIYEVSIAVESRKAGAMKTE